MLLPRRARSRHACRQEEKAEAAAVFAPADALAPSPQPALKICAARFPSPRHRTADLLAHAERNMRVYS